MSHNDYDNLTEIFDAAIKAILTTKMDPEQIIANAIEEMYKRGISANTLISQLVTTIIRQSIEKIVKPTQISLLEDMLSLFAPKVDRN